MNRKRIVLLMALLSIACGLSTPGFTAEQQPIRMAYLQNDIHHLAFWVALEKGFFKEQGVKVEVSGIFKAGPEVMTGFAAGGLDMAYLGEAPSTTAVANKAADVQVVAQVNTEGSALVVSPEHTDIQTLSDLAGKTVAVPGHSTVQDFLLRKALTQAGIAEENVNIIVLKPPEMITALRTGSIDGFIAWEPYPAKASTLGVGRNLLTSAEIWAGHPCCVLASDTEFLNSHPEEVKKIVKAHVQATEYIQAHPEEAVEIGVQYTGMDPETVRRAMRTVNYTPRLSIAGEKEYVQFLNKLQYIRIEDVDQFIERFINSKFLDDIEN